MGGRWQNPDERRILLPQRCNLKGRTPGFVQVAGQLEKLTIFGGDYPTPDGTCQRDYLHVVDLAVGHLKALEYAASHTGVEAINLGTGHGISVLELVHAFETANQIKLPYEIGPRRDGDLAAF